MSTSFDDDPDDLFDGSHVLAGLPDGRDLRAIVQGHLTVPRPNAHRSPEPVVVALVSGPVCFFVVFNDGQRQRFSCPLDAHDHMNGLNSGALRVERSPDGVVTARRDPFTYRAIWNLKVDPQWRPL